MGSSRRPRKTSERVQADHYVANEGDYLIYLFHLATYDFAAPFLTGKTVLDFGCGTGYGTHRMAPSCTSIVGVDVSEEAVTYATEHFVAENLSYRLVPPVEDAALPFPDSSFDVVLSFQVFEHVADTTKYLTEVRRVLRPGGVLLLATPDRSTRLFRGQRPWNRYHRTEWDARGLGQVVGTVFSDVNVNTMTAPLNILQRELRRCQRLRWTLLPFTFPGAPEAWRQFGLRSVKWLENLRASSADDNDTAPLPSYAYDESSVVIAPGVAPSVNLVAVARV